MLSRALEAVLSVALFRDCFAVSPSMRRRVAVENRN